MGLEDLAFGKLGNVGDRLIQPQVMWSEAAGDAMSCEIAEQTMPDSNSGVSGIRAPTVASFPPPARPVAEQTAPEPSLLRVIGGISINAALPAAGGAIGMAGGTALCAPFLNLAAPVCGLGASYLWTLAASEGAQKLTRGHVDSREAHFDAFVGTVTGGFGKLAEVGLQTAKATPLILKVGAQVAERWGDKGAKAAGVLAEGAALGVASGLSGYVGRAGGLLAATKGSLQARAQAAKEALSDVRSALVGGLTGGMVHGALRMALPAAVKAVSTALQNGRAYGETTVWRALVTGIKNWGVDPATKALRKCIEVTERHGALFDEVPRYADDVEELLTMLKMERVADFFGDLRKTVAPMNGQGVAKAVQIEINRYRQLMTEYSATIQEMTKAAEVAKAEIRARGQRAGPIEHSLINFAGQSLRVERNLKYSLSRVDSQYTEEAVEIASGIKAILSRESTER